MAKSESSSELNTSTNAAKATTTTVTPHTAFSSKPTGGSHTGPKTMTFFRAAFLVLAVAAALSYDFVKDFVVDTGLLLGTVQSFNTAGCEAVKGLQACEDIHIHHASGRAFATCGHAESRKTWYPPMNKRNSSTDKMAFQDQFVVYNILSGEYQVIDLVGLPAETDRVFHGLGVHERSATEFTIFAINHRRSGSVIEVLEYAIGDKFALHKETIQHDLIRTPNDIVALGPRSFYVSNDHRYTGGIMRELEGNLRRPWSNVVFYSPEKTFVAFDRVASANGLAANKDNSIIYLSACYGGAIHVLKPQEDYTLEEQDYIKLDYYIDNPSVDPTTGDIFVAGHVQPLKMVMGLKVSDKPVVGPSKVVKLSKNPLANSSDNAPSYLVDTVLIDDGHLISTGTVAALDRKRNVILVGTAFAERGFIRCPIPSGI
ncbi:Serum paraoxonase/arylesterase 2 [Mortierella claussenii]|nr:Serum paraoxonase/arylesterase 2 [Mortierella claussenii]